MLVELDAKPGPDESLEHKAGKEASEGSEEKGRETTHIRPKRALSRSVVFIVLRTFCLTKLMKSCMGSQREGPGAPPALISRIQ